MRGCIVRQEPQSPGPYRSLRELSLAGSVDPDIWCPPTFVGNSGIERSNGDCGFALFFCAVRLLCRHSSRRLCKLSALPVSSFMSLALNCSGSASAGPEAGSGFCLTLSRTNRSLAKKRYKHSACRFPLTLHPRTNCAPPHWLVAMRWIRSSAPVRRVAIAARMPPLDINHHSRRRLRADPQRDRSRAADAEPRQAWRGACDAGDLTA